MKDLEFVCIINNTVYVFGDSFYSEQKAVVGV